MAKSNPLESQSAARLLTKQQGLALDQSPLESFLLAYFLGVTWLKNQEFYLKSCHQSFHNIDQCSSPSK